MKCRHPTCPHAAPPGRVYCSAECYHTDPATRERLERQRLDALAKLAHLRAEGRDPAHGGKVARKRAVKIAESNRAKPRRKKRGEAT